MQRLPYQCIERNAQCFCTVRYHHTGQASYLLHPLAFCIRPENKVYYFESTMTPNLFWLDLNKIDFSPNASIKKLSLTNGEIYAGDAVKDLKDSKGFVFLFQTPVM